MKKAVYTSYGLWQFYYDNGIRCIYPDGKNEELFGGGLDDFDVTADGEEKIYMLCQDEKNYFYLYWYDGNCWHNKCMLESSVEEVYNKNFSLVNVGGWLNAFYTVKHKDSTLIVHHIIFGESEPEIIEKSGDFKSYFALSDKFGNIYCFFARGRELGFKKYMWNEKKWSNYTGIFKFNEEIHYITAAFDENNNYHVAVCIGEENKYKIAYTNEKKAHEIISGGYSVLKPVIVINDKINILFDFAGRVLRAVSDNMGDSFLSAKYFFPGSFNKQGIVKIISADKTGADIRTNYTYGYETDNGKLVPSFLEENIKIEKPKPFEEIKPDIENYIEEEPLLSPPPEYKKEEDGDMLFKMIAELTKRIDKIEAELCDNREIKIVQENQPF